MNVIELLVGAIIGAIFGYFMPIWYEQTRNHIHQRRVAKRRSLLTDKRVCDWLIEYYERNGNLNDLFDCKIGNLEAKIPFLTKDKWQYSSSISPGNDGVLQYAGTADQEFEVNAKLIERRRMLGQTLFNEATLYLDCIEEVGDSIKLYVKGCEYFQVITSLARLEEETFRGIRKRSFGSLPIRDSFFPSVLRAQELEMKPFSVGCAVALVIKTENDYELLIQTRSHSTVTYGGSKAVIPCFGLSPIASTTASSDLLYYNFVKEYCEELFAYEELVTLMGSRRANPYWFYELPEARELQLLLEKEQLVLEFLGFGFDALNGTATIAMLALVQDVEYSTALKRDILVNWEVAERTMSLEPIEFVSVKSPKLEDWLRHKRYHFGSAFTIARVIRRLESTPM